MRLYELLNERKASILQKWFNVIIESYPADTASFLKNQKSQFANPVGATVAQGIDKIFCELLTDMKSENIYKYLDDIVKIRAVQDFTPADAISFVFMLKKVVRENLDKELKEHNLYKELMEFESRIDDVARSAFDIYVKCRERLYEIKANEVKNMTFRLLQKANLIREIP